MEVGHLLLLQLGPKDLAGMMGLLLRLILWAMANLPLSTMLGVRKGTVGALPPKFDKNAPEALLHPESPIGRPQRQGY